MAEMDNKIKERGVYGMKKLLVVIILLIAFPLCLVVWAGLDVEGDLDVTGTSTFGDDITVTGDGILERIISNTWKYAIDDIGIKVTTTTGIGGAGAVDQFTIEARSGTNTDVRLALYPKGTGEAYIVSYTSRIDFTDAELFSTGSAHFGTGSANYRLDVKAGAVIGDETFTGSGLDDLTAGGTFNTTLTDDIDYKVEIDANDTPDTFKWSDDGGSTWDATDVNITGAAQTLNNGITVTFGATDGHTTGDYWEWTVTIHNPMWLQDAAGTGIVYVGNDSKIGFGTESPATLLDVNGVATIGNLTLTDGSITDSSKTIDFSDSNMTTTATGTFEDVTVNGNFYIKDSVAGDYDIRLELLGPLLQDRTLQIAIGDGNKSITLSGNLTVEATSVINSDLSTDANWETSGSVTGGSLITGGNIGRSDDADLIQLTAANAVTVNGTLGVGIVSPSADLHVRKSALSLPTIGGNTAAIIEKSDYVSLSLLAANQCGIQFGDAADENVGIILYDHASNYMMFRTSAAEQVRITSAGKVGIKDTSPASVLDVTGDINTTEQYKVDDVQVVKEQQAHIADAPGDTTANNATTINAILTALEAHGLLAGS